MDIIMILLDVKELDLFTVTLSQEVKEAMLILFLHIVNPSDTDVVLPLSFTNFWWNHQTHLQAMHFLALGEQFREQS